MSDVLIIGGGIVGLCAARACARRGLTVTLLSAPRAGEASSAAGGILSSTITGAPPAVNAFAVTARRGYADFVEDLERRTGVRVGLNMLGILEVAADEAVATQLSASPASGATWLDAGEVRALEPRLAAPHGALLHHADGAVDNVSLLAALRSDVARDPRIRVLPARALRLGSAPGHMLVETEDRVQLAGERVILAAGAWSGSLRGLPRPIPVTPLRGQIVTLAGAPLRHVCYGSHHYLVPRPGGQTLVGSTAEPVGFRPGTTEEGIATLTASARRLAPSLRESTERARWSGLRPAAPDLLPIIGSDEHEPRLLYACGHSRNGILLGPLSGEVVSDLAAGTAPRVDIGPFAASRFETAVGVRDRSLSNPVPGSGR